MSLAIDQPGVVVFCSENLKLNLSQHGYISRRLEVIDDIAVYSVNAQAECLEACLNKDGNISVQKCLDKFFIIKEVQDQKNNSIVPVYFDWIAARYEELIDVSQNRDNIRKLYEHLEAIKGVLHGLSVIDYGCGTALSVVELEKERLNLLGVDICPTMRRIATSRGLKTSSPRDLAKAGEGSIDCAFLSYVMHYFPDSSDMELLWSRLKVGGVLVANFHKGTGVEECSRFFYDLGAKVISYHNENILSIHGPYRAFIKR